MTIATNQPQTIIRKKAGFEVPKEFLETALRKCPTVSGFAVRDVTGGVTSLQTDHTDKAITIENMMEMNKTTKDYEVILHLANLTGKHDSSDIQPYDIVVKDADKPDEEGTTILSFSVEGDFPKYSDPASGHTDEYNFAHDIVIPMVEQMFEDVEGDIGKFTAKLHNPMFAKNLMAHVGHRAVFVFLPLEGDPICFGENQLGAEFEWGQVSQHHEFGQKPVQEAAPITTAVTAVKKKFGFLSKKTTSDGKPLPEGVHETPKPAAPHPDAVQKAEPKKKEEPVHVAPKTETAAGRTKVEIAPPPRMHGDAKNLWFRLFNDGELPKNHQSKGAKIWVYPEQVPFAERDISTKQEVKALAEEIKKGKPAAPVDMKKPEPTPVAKKEEPKKVEAPLAKQEARSPADFIPDMTDKEMTEQTTILASFVDRDKVPSALEIQKMESKWPTYSEKMGIPFADLLRYTVADISAICGGNKPAVMLILEMRRKLIEKMDVKDLVNTAAVKTETEKHVAASQILRPEPKVETKQVGGTTIVDVKPTAEAKRSKFTFGKKSAA